MQAVIDACRSGRLAATPALVISNNSGSGALTRARNEGVPGLHLSSVMYPAEDLDSQILDALLAHNVNLIVLAGYMKLLPESVISHFRDRILNIHPALLPRYGGKGFYGEKVHSAVLAAGDHETGVTIHLVNEEYDSGRIIAQDRIPVLSGDTPDSLAERVLKKEHALLVETLISISEGRIEM